MASARDRRTGFSRRRQYGVFFGYVLLVAGAAIGGVLLAVSTFDPPAFAALRMTVASVTVPVSAAGSVVVDAVLSVPDMIGDHFRVKTENGILRGRLANERAVVLRARAILHDNARLRRLLAIRDATSDTVVTARLVASTPSSTRRFAMLDAGRWQGVQPGMPVRGPDGLIGRVLETGPAVARILLLTDPDSVVPVRRLRDGLPAIAQGRGDGLVDIRSVETADVRFQAGDIFVSSGIGGIYAPGIPVARIPKLGRDTVAAQTFARPDTIDFAIVERPFLPIPAAVAALPGPVPTPAPKSRAKAK
ncbi:rod shape-determining protein MreC [Sphingomonas bacterium]|uniref:rod shape-determining protein MreC n=1 Tax=Sphingomonas bacterium TaxID=1895847 RepID=UPI0015763AD2|nr:rod shape-determining protein MreC [Sphingomonas bacterium]